MSPFQFFPAPDRGWGLTDAGRSHVSACWGQPLCCPAYLALSVSCGKHLIQDSGSSLLVVAQAALVRTAPLHLLWPPVPVPRVTTPSPLASEDTFTHILQQGSSSKPRAPETPEGGEARCSGHGDALAACHFRSGQRHSRGPWSSVHGEPSCRVWAARPFLPFCSLLTPWPGSQLKGQTDREGRGGERATATPASSVCTQGVWLWSQLSAAAPGAVPLSAQGAQWHVT